MKIISAGVATRKLCSQCNCEFEYNPEDVQTTWTKSTYVICPWCGYHLVISIWS
jgi:DNA-directed RNA polymerase subunit RPC12/RpoP